MKTLSHICAVLFAVPFIAAATPLPDTGQTKCYDNTQEITCPQPGEPFYGQDSQYITTPQSYTKLDANGNDLPNDAPWPWSMVRDNVTGLIWEMKTDDGSIHDKDNIYWYENIYGGDILDVDDFISLLNAAQFGGYSDWRVPTIKELISIVNRDTFVPTINTLYFPNTESDYAYWSSTILAYDQYRVCVGSFTMGGVSTLDRYDHITHVRAVRGRPFGPFDNYIDNGDGTVTDIDTGLMWEQESATVIYTWERALHHCDTLSHAGYYDWRLPNANELHSLVDYTRYNPSINPVFPNTASNFYWSSDTPAYSYYYTWAYYVDFLRGMMAITDKSGGSYVRCERGGQCGPSNDFDGDVVCDDGDNSGTSGDNPCAGGEKLNCDDNCPSVPNSLQEDSSPLQGNGIGDACDCEADFMCDGDVDGTDASAFKFHFGRNTSHYPCAVLDPCRGDFSCDGDVDGSDASLFKQDFGRSSIQNPCPVCVAGEWCNY